ncbi:MAG: DUF3883 domain-containing protein [Thermodesulfobacteriota bacterium]
MDILRECDLQTSHYIEKRYKERASHFAQTLAFLNRIGLVKHRKGALVLQDQLPATHNINFLSTILEHLVLSKSRYNSEIVRYLGKYAITGTQVSYRSNERTRSEESAIRNFLMEMGVIAYIRHEDRYVVSPEHLCFYIQARQEHKLCPPLRLTEKAEARDEIALEAERAVVAFEKERVGPLLSHHVEHVALRNAAAGFDILSVAAETPMDVTKRYIEVKAVSPASFQFYWTRNEVEVARLLGPLYYLYLVPVGTGYEIGRDRFVIISDPYADVLGPGGKWVVENDVILCRPA